MKTKKVLSLLLSILMLVSLLPMSAFAADGDANIDAGMRLFEKNYDSATNIMTLAAQVKLPAGAGGITTASVTLFYDSTKLTLLNAANPTKSFEPTFPEAKGCAAALHMLILDTDDSPYQAADVYVAGKDGRAVLFAGIAMGPSSYVIEDLGTDWYDLFEIKFKVDGDAAAVLSRDSIRIATVEQDDELVASACFGNNWQMLRADASKAYFYGPMSGCTDMNAPSGYEVMAHPDNATATYTGCTNVPSLPALPSGSVTISGDAKLGGTLTAVPAGMPADAGVLSYKWYANDTEIANQTAATFSIPESADYVGKVIKVEVSAANYSGNKSASTSSVEKADGPSAPTVAMVSRTDTSITVTSNAAWEYALNEGSWQGSNTFTGLAAGTEYSIKARVKETDVRKASAASAPVAISTKSVAGSAVPPTVESKTDNSITAAVVAGQKYMIKPADASAPAADAAGWQDTAAFTGLTRNTSYKIYSYIPETEEKAASGIVFTEVTTEKTTITELLVPVTDLSKTYTPAQAQEPAFSGDLAEGTDYTVSYAVVSGGTLSSGKPTGAGTYKVTVSGTGDYKGSFTKDFTVLKADSGVSLNHPMNLKYSAAGGEYPLGSIMPSDAGSPTYTAGSSSKTGSVSVTAFSVDGAGKVVFTLSGGAIGNVVTLPVTVKSDNYQDVTVNVVVTLVAKQAQAPLTFAGGSVVYGKTLNLSASGGSGSGTVSFVVVGGDGAASITGNVLTATKAGNVSVKAVKAEDDDYAEASAIATITVRKADPTGIPGYTAITCGGMTLSDAALTVGSITPAGTIAWNSGAATVVAENTAYNWTFTPSDTVNYNTLTGRITPYEVYADSDDDIYYSSDSYDVRVAGTVHGSVRASSKTAVLGQLVTLTVNADKGYKLASITVTDKDGGKVDLTAVKAGSTYTFKKPVGAVTVKAVFAADKNFSDVPADAYYSDAVLWAVEKGITVGTSETTFSPDMTCSRAQIVTFLWRAAGSPEPKSMTSFSDVVSGSYYEKAVAWAVEKGITNGTSADTFSPDMDCNRAQAVTFLMRAAGSPKPKSPTSFSDVVSGSYYENAVAWAVEKGITNGTSGDTFSPDMDCSRAQIVTFLYRQLAD